MAGLTTEIIWDSLRYTNMIYAKLIDIQPPKRKNFKKRDLDKAFKVLWKLTSSDLSLADRTDFLLKEKKREYDLRDVGEFIVPFFKEKAKLTYVTRLIESNALYIEFINKSLRDKIAPGTQQYNQKEYYSLLRRFPPKKKSLLLQVVDDLAYVVEKAREYRDQFFPK